jgi:hypothetical protein
MVKYLTGDSIVTKRKVGVNEKDKSESEKEKWKKYEDDVRVRDFHKQC